jgi:hypothetical protein
MRETSNAARTRGGAAASAWTSRHRISSPGTAGRHRGGQWPDFRGVNAAALATLPALLERWLPDGRREGNEYVARNPRRQARHRGSFKINLMSGAWADFATGDRGGDVISLAAFLAGTSQAEAARKLARMLGLEVGQ